MGLAVGLDVGDSDGADVGDSDAVAVGLALPGDGLAGDSAGLAVALAVGPVPPGDGSPPVGVPQDARSSSAAAAVPRTRTGRDVVGDM